MNKKERRLALATALQSAAGDMLVVEDLAGKLPAAKTKNLVALLQQVGNGGHQAAPGTWSAAD
jgi:large subunit ribosomal protein L4